VAIAELFAVAAGSTAATSAAMPSALRVCGAVAAAIRVANGHIAGGAGPIARERAPIDHATRRRALQKFEASTCTAAEAAPRARSQKESG